ncbi:MAG: hypothetical protein ABSA79_10475 [Candidatus Bathyarchaeia archaeon]|jgi:ParB-like chromosome segregation protein Spo0J
MSTTHKKPEFSAEAKAPLIITSSEDFSEKTASAKPECSNSPDFERFLEMAKPFLEVDANGKPKITKTATGPMVTLREDILTNRDAFAKILELFSQVDGEWINSNHFAFIIRQSSLKKEHLLDVSLSDLVEGPQPRLYRSGESKQRLVSSVKGRLAKGYPPFTDRLKTRPSKSFPGKHEVVDGYGRWDIALVLDLPSVPLIEREMTDSEAYEISYIANEDRDEFTDFERGKYFKDMLKRFPNEYPSIRILAEKLGENYSRIGQLTSFYDKLCLEEKNLLSEVFTRVNEKPESVLRPAFRAPKTIVSQVLTKIIEEDLTRRKGELYVTDLNSKVAAGVSPEKALEEVNFERVSNEEALKNLQAQTAEEVKAEEAKVTKLKKLYPADIVDDVIRVGGWFGPAKTIQVLKGLVGDFWKTLSEEEKKQRILDKVQDSSSLRGNYG